MKQITFNVTTDEANLILEGLGHIPFARVYNLVAKLQEQAQQQMNGSTPTDQEKEIDQPVEALEN